jgi:MYXO-CTERM domain-containing protein
VTIRPATLTGEVPATNTPISAGDTTALLARIAPEYFPGITKDAILAILSHIWVETAGGKSLKQFNFGNVSASKQWTETKSFWRPPWYSDASNPIHERMLKGQAPNAFQAYDTFDSGLRDYLKTIQKFAPQVMSGDPYQYAQGVWDSYYCRDKNCSPEILGDTLGRLMASFGASITPRSTGGAGEWLALGLLGVGALFFSRRKKGGSKRVSFPAISTGLSLRSRRFRSSPTSFSAGSSSLTSR